MAGSDGKTPLFQRPEAGGVAGCPQKDFCRSAAKTLDAVQHDRYMGGIARTHTPETPMTTRAKTPAADKTST